MTIKVPSSPNLCLLLRCAQGRRVWGVSGGQTQRAGRVMHKKATMARPRLCDGYDSGHPTETKMSGFGAIHSFPASLLADSKSLDAPLVPEPPAHSPAAHPHARALHPRAPERPKYTPTPVQVLFTSSLSFSDVPLAPSKAFPRERSRGCCIN